MNKHVATLTMLAALTLAGCGGGDEGQRANVVVLPDELLTPPCPACQPATVQGVAAAGKPFANADVTVIDRHGAQRSTRTDSAGHFLLPVQGLDAPFVIRVTGLLNGQTRTLHTVVLATEVGRALSNITPLTEVLTAQVLQGLPHDLLQDGRADFQRINTRAVRSAHAELERLVRPVLDAAGVPTPTDLRSTAFQANHTGLDLALDGLVLTQEQGAYQLRHVQAMPEQALLLDPTGASSTEPLSAPPSMATLQSLQTITTQVNASLAALTTAFAHRVPPGFELAPFLTPDFLGDGLNASSHITQVWRRQDSQRAGGFSLQGAKWHGASVLQIQDADKVLVAVRVEPRAPFAPYTDTAWMQRNGGTWQWKGNGKLASVVARHASVLGPGPSGFSTEVSTHLSFEVDRRRVDPRVAQILVRGPGLPEAGVSLAPPAEDDDAIGLWTWAGRSSDDWPAVPMGWCPDQGDALPACQESWAEVRTGSSYTFTLLDTSNQTLQTLTASLPPKPLSQSTPKAQLLLRFTRFLPDAADTSWLPTLAHITAPRLNPYQGDLPLPMRLQFAATPMQGVDARFDLFVDIPATASTDRTFAVQRLKQSIGPGTAGQAQQLSAQWAPASTVGAQSRWASLRLTSTDPAGNLCIHAIGPQNPR